MENVVLTIHLLLALALIGVVLMQRSEGGGLGIGGGGGGGAMGGRSAATALSKVTWVLAIAFLTTSLTLTILASRSAQGDSVIERLGVESSEPAQVPLPSGLDGDLTPPPTAADPAAPQAPE